MQTLTKKNSPQREAAEAEQSTRLAFVRQVVAQLVEAGTDASTAEQRILYDLAHDQSWQVRREVATHLADLPECLVPHLADSLLQDSHAYVSREAQRTMRLRERRSREVSERRQKQTRIARQIAKLRGNQTHPVAKRVGRICQQHGEELVGQLVHDLRGVLVKLKSASANLLQSSGDNESAQAIRVQVETIEHLANEWERFSEPLRLELRQEVLSDVVTAAIGNARRLARREPIDLSNIETLVEINPGLLVPMSRHLIEIAVTNVVQNAIEAMDAACSADKKFQIRVTATVVANQVELQISDNGPGMSAEEVEFVSALIPGRRNRAKPSSTGFGLPIAARNIGAHGGSLHIASNETAGTQITITLPLTAKEGSRS